jgi:8-oxo-dGTP pyrophosphatase MutT (NUDIX family)
MQKYKIYINENMLYFLDTEDPELNSPLTVYYRGTPKSLFQVIDLLEKHNGERSTVQLICSDPQSAFKKFASLYTVEKASGGIILNAIGEVLFIYRRGKWDLPKGKIDPGEGKLEAAKREIKEEVGLTVVGPGAKFMKTNHTYKNRVGVRVLKKTNWYIFQHLNKEAIQVQAEEDIVAYHWIAPELFLKSQIPTYESISDLIQNLLDSDAI